MESGNPPLFPFYSLNYIIKHISSNINCYLYVRVRFALSIYAIRFERIEEPGLSKKGPVLSSHVQSGRSLFSAVFAKEARGTAFR